MTCNSHRPVALLSRWLLAISPKFQVTLWDLTASPAPRPTKLIAGGGSIPVWSTGAVVVQW